MSTIAVITARGGSKRIPRKNIKEFCGKPIITYSIEAALSAGIFDEVMVSTDDAQIAEIAKKAMKTGESIRNLILREGLLSEKEMETVLDPVNMTEPGISGKELLRK